MACLYAMSDMHGDQDAFERALEAVDLTDPQNRLILCGDYLPPPDTDTTLMRAIMGLQEDHPGQVIALMGNHELAYLADHETEPSSADPVLAWARALPFYWETDTQIFVHAGVDEEAEDLWKVGTEDAFFCQKFPHETGPFLKDIIAGHVSTAAIAQDPAFRGVYWDGASHFYLDGAVHVTHQVPVLKYDTVRQRYTQFCYDAEGRPFETEVLGPDGEPCLSSEPRTKEAW